MTNCCMIPSPVECGTVDMSKGEAQHTLLCIYSQQLKHLGILLRNKFLINISSEQTGKNICGDITCVRIKKCMTKNVKITVSRNTNTTLQLFSLL
jgi:hypothetical protein